MTSSRKYHRLVLGLILAGLGSPAIPACGQQSSESLTELQDLKEQVKRIEARIEKLEAAAAAAPKRWISGCSANKYARLAAKRGITSLFPVGERWSISHTLATLPLGNCPSYYPLR